MTGSFRHHRQGPPAGLPVMCRAVACIVAGLCWLAPAFPARAGTATANLSVQLQIDASCTIGAATLNFGSASLMTSPVNQSTTVSVTCTNAAPYAIGMDNGTNASSGQRRMAYSGAYLNYNLYVDSAHVYPWSTAASNSTCTTTGDCYLGTGNGTAQSVNIYGVVPAVGTAPAAGLYTDTVVMTITY